MIKFTFLLLCLSVNYCFAQVKPSTASERSAAVTQRKMLDDSSPLKNLKFRNIGPTNMSGRVVDVDVNPQNPTEFFVAYASGGLWHTTNNGQSLLPVFENENAYSIGDIAVDWPSRTIWVGTGESNSSRSSYSGNGIYKSTDNGKKWEYVGLPETQHIGKIVLHPTDKNIAWVGAIGRLYSPNKERGVFKTTDGGKTWKHSLQIDDNTGVIEMDINPKNPDELYACAWYRTRRAWNFEEAGKTSGIYKSTDGGNNWKLVTTPASGFPTGDKIGRIGVAVHAANPSIVYAIVDNQNNRPDTAQKKADTNYVLKDFRAISKENFLLLDDKKLDSFLVDNNFAAKYSSAYVKKLVREDSIKSSAIFDYLLNANTALFETPIIGCEIYRSDDAGMTWKKANSKGLELYNTYGYYFGKLTVAPDDANKLVILGYDLEVSTDGGKTFKVKDKISTHADWHTCWINPTNNNHWVAGNDGGCNVTYDNGDHWFKANTPAVAQFYNITTDNARPYNVYGGLQDNGVWFGPSTAKESDQWNYENPYAWKRMGGGDGMQVQVDTRDNKTLYSGSQFGFYSRRSTDGGRGTSIYPRHDLGAEAFRYNWQTPILLSRHNQDILYYGTNRLHRSMNKAETMEVLSGDLTNGKKEGDIPFGTFTTMSESPLKFGLLYIGTDDGNVQVSKDGGYSFTLVSNKLPQGLYVSRVRASQYKLSRVYVTLNGYRNDHFASYVYVSEDFGDTWTAIGKNLPAEPVNVIIEDNKEENILYLGTDNGLYTSFDKGQSFITMGQALPNVAVHDLAIQARENELVVGTHGRSIFITKLDEVQKQYANKK
ncbi:MAG: glycosyl hydrolase [Gloeobacteraceae cyanobacterium ES-bin-316]|nr:glycosyl hydrolase [Ferruginibacter sp.]